MLLCLRCQVALAMTCVLPKVAALCLAIKKALGKNSFYGKNETLEFVTVGFISRDSPGNRFPNAFAYDIGMDLPLPRF